VQLASLLAGAADRPPPEIRGMEIDLLARGMS
jgi:hypothetical protein